MNGVMVVCQLIGCYIARFIWNAEISVSVAISAFQINRAMIVTLYCSLSLLKVCVLNAYLALPYDLRKIESDSDYANGLMYNIKMITTPLVSFERKFLGLALLA